MSISWFSTTVLLKIKLALVVNFTRASRDWGPKMNIVVVLLSLLLCVSDASKYCSSKGKLDWEGASVFCFEKHKYNLAVVNSKSLEFVFSKGRLLWVGGVDPSIRGELRHSVLFRSWENDDRCCKMGSDEFECSEDLCKTKAVVLCEQPAGSTNF